MSVKRLLPLVALLLVLIGLAVVLKRQPTPPSLVQEAGLVRLVPATLHADAIRGFDLYHGAHPQDTLRLRKEQAGWVIQSHFNAPGKHAAIQPFVEQLSSLEGELRSDNADVLDAYGLAEQQALHLLIYTDNLEKPALHLLAGKGSGSNSFIRREGENSVYRVDLNIRARAELHDEKTEQAPAAKAWADLHVLDIPPEQITGLELHTPTRQVRLLRTPVVAPAAPSATATAPTAPQTAAPKAQEPAAQDQAPAPEQVPTPAPEPTWTLVQPELDYALQQDAVKNLVGSWQALQGDDIADPAKLATYGLDKPPYQAILTVQAPDKELQQRVVSIGNEVSEAEGKRYARVGDSGPLYQLPKWTWSRLFPSLGTLLALQVVQTPVDEVTRLTVQQDGTSWSLERQTVPNASGEKAAETSWHRVADPEAPVEASTVMALLQAAANLKAEDILPADAPAPAALDKPVATLALTRQQGQTVHLTLGQASDGKETRAYVKRQDKPAVFLLSAAVYKTLTDDLSKLKPAPAPAQTPILTVPPAAGESSAPPATSVPAPETPK